MRQKAEEQAQLRKAEQERLQSERQAQIARQQQQAEQRRIEQAKIRQQRIANPPPPQKKGIDLASPETASRYFIYSGIFFIIIALLICGVKAVKFFMWSK